MQHDHHAAEQRILAQCSGLSCWLDGSDERQPAGDRLQATLGDRLFTLIVGGLSARRSELPA